VHAENWDSGAALTWTASSTHCQTDVVRYLLDQGSNIDHQNQDGETALTLACTHDHEPVARLLLERGADPTTANYGKVLSLICANAGPDSSLDLVRLLLSDPRVIDTINHRSSEGRTALSLACMWGHREAARLLLQRGADPTIPTVEGMTPMDMATSPTVPCWAPIELRQTCVKPLKVSGSPSSPPPARWVTDRGLMWQEAEAAYRLWKTRELADSAASFAATPVVEAVPEELRGRAAAGGSEGLPGVSVVLPEGAAEKSQETAALLDHVVHQFKPGVFEELMAMMGTSWKGTFAHGSQEGASQSSY
jgi:hypothetical protein